MKKILFLLALICSLQCPVYAADKEVDAVMQDRDTAISKANDAAIKKLEAILTARTKKGDLDGALAVKSVIQKIKGGDAPANADIDIAGVPANPAGKSEVAVKKEISSRYAAFTNALIEDNFDAAYEFMDPKMRENAAPQLVKGILKVWSGMLKVAQVPKDGAKITSVKLGMKENDAKVTPALKIRGLNWEDQKAAYWVLRNGKWYLGDEKELDSFK